MGPDLHCWRCCHSGTAWQRVVGQVAVAPGNNLTAELANAYRIMNAARPWNFSLSVGEFRPSVQAPVVNSSASTSGLLGERPPAGKSAFGRTLLAVSLNLPCQVMCSTCCRCLLAKRHSRDQQDGVSVERLSIPCSSCNACLPAGLMEHATRKSQSVFFAGNRRLLLQVNLASIETQYQFNAYNDFASLDFRVTFNVRLP